jgi:hypothetical protein
VIGRSYRQDTRWPAYDAQDKFGAATQYLLQVQRPYDLTPRAPRPYWSTTNASNKPSEHNTFNGPRFIPVAQLAAQTSPPNLRNLISYRAQLRPGNQSLGGT